MNIRKAAIDDIKKIYRLLCELEDSTLPYNSFKEIFTVNLNNQLIYYFICENDGNILAFASLHIQNLLHHCSKIAEIQELVVKSDYRGNGIGKDLIEFLIKTAKENNCSLLEVCCNQKRKQAHNFYQHCGMINSHYKFTYKIIN